VQIDFGVFKMCAINSLIFVPPYRTDTESARWSFIVITPTRLADHACDLQLPTMIKWAGECVIRQ